MPSKGLFDSHTKQKNRIIDLEPTLSCFFMICLNLSSLNVSVTVQYSWEMDTDVSPGHIKCKNDKDLAHQKKRDIKPGTRDSI